MKKIIYFIFPLLCFIGCNKAEFLDKNYNQSYIVPSTLSDFEAILNKDVELNASGNTTRGPIPGLGEAGSDDYYLLDADFNGTLQSLKAQNFYIWSKEPYDGTIAYDWVWPYTVIFYANTVLDGLQNVIRTQSNATYYDRIKGSALFIRAHTFYQLAQVFAPPYDEATASSDWGIPLRLTAEVEEKVSRATLKATYDKIIEDLETSVDLLPDQPMIKTRPGKQASYALLARIYQTMRKYDQSQKYVKLSLAIQNELLDYNTVNSSLTYPFRPGAHEHKEVIFACKIIADPYFTFPFGGSISYIPADLYDLYSDGDLRKSVFFGIRNGLIFYKGSYDGKEMCFGGIATDELYLIRAENYAREGKLSEALADVNLLLESRWDKNKTFIPFYSNDQEEVLNIVLTERRKELIFRALRWTDLRRLNLEGRNITLQRTVNGQTYILPPNDPRYTYPIPDEVISFNPGMPQNER